MGYYTFLEIKTNKKIRVNKNENILIKYLANNPNYKII